MKETLDILSKEEYDVLRQVKAMSGTIENIESQIKERHVPEIYKRIYNSYNSLYNDTKDLEAFKRLIFIQWYAASEPLAYTGIGELDAELEKHNLQRLIDLINTKAIDKEFKEMVLHYYSVADWYFDSHFDFSQFLSEKNTNADLNLPFTNRGQMGEYWNTLQRT